jgi:hypothetical protein
VIHGLRVRHQASSLSDEEFDIVASAPRMALNANSASRW